MRIVVSDTSCMIDLTLSLIFHSVTPIQGLCFRSAHNPFWLFDLHF